VRSSCNSATLYVPACAAARLDPSVGLKGIRPVIDVVDRGRKLAGGGFRLSTRLTGRSPVCRQELVDPGHRVSLDPHQYVG